MVKRSRESSIQSTDSSERGSTGTTDAESPRPSKLNAVMVDAAPPKTAMQCSLPPHRDSVDFATIEDFEVHYAMHHSNRCSSCGKNFPTPHFLALHMDEHHNTIREALQGRGEKTFACFVQDCDKLCSTPQKRRLHLIDKHLFPKMYNFRMVDTGIDKSTSMLHESRRRRISVDTDQGMSNGIRRRQSQVGKHQLPATVSPVTAKATRVDVKQDRLAFRPAVSGAAIKDLESSMSALRFVPPQVKQPSKQGPV